jgi:F-type H+-transporting ATPase subunit c
VQESCFAIARQPFFQEKIIRLMLLTQSIIQTPIIFAFIVAMLIKNQALYAVALIDALRLVAGGLCIGLGCIGPALGLSIFARTACKSLGINRSIYNNLLSFTLVSQAIIETPIVFSFVISLILITFGSNHQSPALAIATTLGAAFCMGIGTLGPGISSGKTAATACERITQTPEQYLLLSRLSMLGQGIIDTGAIYAFTIAMLLLFLA